MTVSNKYCIYNYLQGRYWTDGKGDIQMFSFRGDKGAGK